MSKCVRGKLWKSRDTGANMQCEDSLKLDEMENVCVCVCVCVCKNSCM